MASLNKVFLMGNLTRDPDLRGLPSGQSVCELRLAVSRRFTNGSGQEQEEVCFVDVSVWGKAANNCRQYLTKGSQVMVEGRLRLDTWEDRNGGGQRSKLCVVAENVQFMNRRRDDNGDNGSYQNNYQQNSYPQDNYSAPQNNYRQSAPPRHNDAPPMPETSYPRNGGVNPPVPEDDIPF